MHEANSGWDESKCHGDKSALGVALGSFLIVANVLSFFPQFFRIIRRRSSLGLSPWTLFLSNAVAYLSFANGLLLQWDEILCCRVQPFPHCQRSLLAVYQLATSPFTQGFLFALFMYYYEFTGTLRNLWENRVSKLLISAYLLLVVLLLSLVGACLLLFQGADSPPLKGYAFALGVMSAVCIVIQWLPQIVKTVMNRSPGSLSVLTLLIQAPGSFVSAFFQWYFYHESVSTWGPYAVTGLQQSILVLLCIWFSLGEAQKRRRRRRKAAIVEKERARLVAGADPNSASTVLSPSALAELEVYLGQLETHHTTLLLDHVDLDLAGL